jgi:hypothetical protein
MSAESAIRATLATAAGAVLAAVFFWASARGASWVPAPRAWPLTLLVPAAAGLVVSLGAVAPHRVLAPAGAVVAVAAAAAAAITGAWLPLAWAASVAPLLGVGAAAGALAGALVPDLRVRAPFAALVAVAPVGIARLGALHAEPVTETTVTQSVNVAAPVHELWEALLGTDSIAEPPRGVRTRIRRGNPVPVAVSVVEPRPQSVRRVAFADSVVVEERAAEWEDDERLRLVAAPSTPDVPIGVAAWRAGGSEGAVVYAGAIMALEPVGDTASRLTMTGAYRVVMHGRAWVPGWLERVARSRQDVLLAAFKARAEARVNADAPVLTAEMRYVRDQLLDAVGERATSTQNETRAAAWFVNADRAVEIVDEAPPTAEGPGQAAARLRESLGGVAARARTTALVVLHRADADTVAGRARDSLRLEFEDWHGRCIVESAPVTLTAGGALTRGAPRRSRCEPTVMAERARRARLIAQLPLRAGEPDDNWSVLPLVRGVTRVYLDSVVLRADTLILRGKTPDAATSVVDSLRAGLSVRSERAWFVARHGTAITPGRSFAVGEEMRQSRVRFTIPVDSAFDLTTAWPTFTVVLSVPRTSDNPYGRAWTYAHAPMEYFAGVKR